LTQAEIAVKLHRSHAEIFRMLTRLAHSDDLNRDGGSRAAYRLSRKLFELAHRDRKVDPLINTALMQALAREAGRYRLLVAARMKPLP
jgi:DNA-binding IclR family transcriptional regulator